MDDLLTLSTPCEEWADKFIRTHPGGVKIYIEPKMGQCLGEVMVKGQKRTTNWTEHYAVYYNDKVFDELHPRGVSVHSYKRFFKEWPAIKFKGLP